MKIGIMVYFFMCSFFCVSFHFLFGFKRLSAHFAFEFFGHVHAPHEGNSHISFVHGEEIPRPYQLFVLKYTFP